MYGTKIVIPVKNSQSVLEALDFYTDEDKSQEDNLIDCFSDFHFQCIDKTENYLVFTFAPDDSEDEANIDWEIINQLASYLSEESIIEERIPYMEDENGREYNGAFVGTIEQGVLVRRCYEFIRDGDSVKRILVEEFDRSLGRQ